MLFLLTGDVQIGKTRWLEALCADLSAADVCVAGVIAPGQWVPRPTGQLSGRHDFDGAGRFEKLGIDNVLLPQGMRIEFAKRRDLANAGDAFAEGGQARAAQLGWAISDEAIAQVNAHFGELAQAAGVACAGCVAAAGPKSLRLANQLPGETLLVVDELGRLELMCGCGLTNAVALLDAGPTSAFPHALVVVRETLLDCACERFAPAWGAPVAIRPTDDARREIFNAFGL